MIQVILLLIFQSTSWGLHPFHLSICELKHDADSKSLQISSRLFLDDLEVALSHRRGAKNYFTEVGDSVIKEDLKKYFEEHLKVSINGHPRTSQFLGFEIEDNVVWCYLEINKVKSMQEVFLIYTPLIDTFDDQINLAHIRYQGKVRSLKFQRDQLSGKATFPTD